MFACPECIVLTLGLEIGHSVWRQSRDKFFLSPIFSHEAAKEGGYHIAKLWEIPEEMFRLHCYIFLPRALKEADVIVLLGARLNWILHFGNPPRFSATVKMIQANAKPKYVRHPLHSVCRVYVGWHLSWRDGKQCGELCYAGRRCESGCETGALGLSMPIAIVAL
jgi:hypothetical protein